MDQEPFDDYGFWDDVPTTALERVTQRLPRVTARRAPRPAGSRHHGDITRSLAPPVDAVDAVDPVDPVDEYGVQRPVMRGPALVDPAVRKIGLVAAGLALLVPVAMAFRPAKSSASVTVATELTQPATSESTAEAPGAPVASSAPTTVVLDPDLLPPAIPVEQPAAETPTTQAPAHAAAAPAPAPAAAASAATPAGEPAHVDAAPVARSAACSPKYTVNQGDYWIGIADRAGVSLAALLSANGAGPSTPLYPGRSICLPQGAAVPPPSTAVPAPATTQPPAPATTAAPKSTTPPKSAAPPTTTAAPKSAAPATTVYQPKKSYTSAEVQQIIRDIWPDDLEAEALRIAQRESRFVPTAKNFCCYGLFQINYSAHKSWLAQIGVTDATQLFDPRVNAWAAFVLYDRSGGWSPWKL